MYSRICDKCKKICQKTPYGICVILCKEDKILCMKCNFERLLFNEFKFKYNILKFLRNRELCITT